MTTAIKPIETYRHTDGDTVLHPIPADRGAALMQALEAFDDDFADLLVADQKATLPLQGAAPANPKCSSA
jgi:antitoxin VapB